MPFQSTKLALLSLLLFAVSCASNEQKVRAKQADLYFGAGTQGLMEQDYTTALTNLLKAHELDPESSEILTNLGMAYFFKGQRDLAVKSLKDALKLKETNSDAKVNLASIYYQEGRINEAEALYKQVVGDLTYDKQARTYYNLALIELEARRNAQAAEKYLLLSIKEDINYCPSHLKLGMIQQERRMLQTALKTFKDATLGTCYDSPAPHYFQALTLAQLGRADEARMKFEEVINRFRSDAYAVKARAKVVELNEIRNNYHSIESRTPRKVLESPEF